MRVSLNYRQSLIKSEISPNFFDCCLTIAEMDGGGEIAGILELTSYPENLIKLGEDIIKAALEMKQQMEKNHEPFAAVI